MTNDEFQMTNQIRNPNSQWGTLAPDDFLRSFEPGHSFDIGHSDLVIVQVLLASTAIEL
jgi:hypothetical protein